MLASVPTTVGRHPSTLAGQSQARDAQGLLGVRDDHFHRAVALTAQFGAAKPWREMVSGRYTLDQAGDALEAVESRRAIKAIITPNPALFV